MLTLGACAGVGESDLQRAVKDHDPVAVRRLLDAGANPRMTFGEMTAATTLALTSVEKGNAASVEVLVAFLAADLPDEGIGIGRSPRSGRHMANGTFTPPCYRSTGSRGCPSYGAVELVARSGNADAVQALIDAGLDVRSEASANALAFAAEYFMDDVAAVLVAAGADPNARSTRDGALGKVTPLEAAVRQGNRPLADWLRAHGAR